uniref:Uncharacterized protein n=1 Tax=Melanopsichium pennsylvanicum 4 TaxID=1398559 RepID=A0A077RAA2_9BASI|nr:uncharacterized protein BN887_05842 [Melanopsichium pennsylvanicum 4]
MSGCDSDEPIIQYGEPHAAGRDQRGVLVYSLHDKPTIHWQELMSAFQAYRSAMNPNVVRFHMPAFVQIHHWKGIQAQLQRSFSLAFPDKKPATISFFKHESGYRNIDIETRFDNVPAADIVAAAAQHGWKVGHAPLGSPEFVSFLTDALLHPVQLDNIPLNLMNEFILSLPDFFKHFNHPAIEIRIVDVWEMQRKVRMKSTGATHKATTWLYFGSMIVLIEFTKPLPGLGRIYDVVHDWPGPTTLSADPCVRRTTTFTRTIVTFTTMVMGSRRKTTPATTTAITTQAHMVLESIGRTGRSVPRVFPKPKL